jgi:glutamate formiminotransferase / formiminotetrahydrofolate cyclodeaminase
MSKLIECVPNFSEGRDPEIIRQITDAIASANGVSLLDVDPGETTNRTVVTFVGTPKATVEAALERSGHLRQGIGKTRRRGIKNPRLSL